jgi:hypothetical protein
VLFRSITESGIELQFFFFLRTTDMDVFAQQRDQILMSLLKLAQDLDIRFDTKTQEFVLPK